MKMIIQRLDWACNQILEQYRNNETALTYKLYIYCDWRQHHLVFSVANQIQMFYPNNFHAYNANLSYGSLSRLTEDDSRYLVKIAFGNVKESFEFNKSAYDFAVVYGFSGG